MCGVLFSSTCLTLHPKKYMKMKVKLTPEAIQQLLADPEKAKQVGVTTKTPWWLIVVKVVKYICELLIVGGASYAAVSCAPYIV